MIYYLHPLISKSPVLSRMLNKIWKPYQIDKKQEKQERKTKELLSRIEFQLRPF